MPDQPSPRRRFQFRLRTLMIVVAALAVYCGPFVWLLDDRQRLIQERDDAVERGVQVEQSAVRWGRADINVRRLHEAEHAEIVDALRHIKELSANLPAEFQIVQHELADLYEKTKLAQDQMYLLEKVK